jgi:hypothetical protein
MQFTRLITTAKQHATRLVVVKLPTPSQFRRQLPNEANFDTALATVLTSFSVPLVDLSAELNEQRYYFDTDHLNRAGMIELFHRRLKDLLRRTSVDRQPENTAPVKNARRDDAVHPQAGVFDRSSLRAPGRPLPEADPYGDP